MVSAMKAEIIAVGSELLTPDRLDTNSLFLTEELNKLETLKSCARPLWVTIVSCLPMRFVTP